LHLADHTYEALEVKYAAEALAERSAEWPAQPVIAYPNPGFAVSNQKRESERFLALNTRHLRR
jgi:hypothetical protein